ncbi:MAG: hypothetical protein DI536_14530 [Archangium gephyra]|uniref:Uncharacterized protein n=1 Tax=Archangium gephyra TaxID=48 RepID=A0A2W5VQM3_9BACT|nr:MAG: hypothetical protein DI536_14530 [Archangium gephyra]
MTLATVLIDPPTTLFAGAVLALISLKLIRGRGMEEVWRVGQLAAAWGLVYGVSVAWHFFNRTDWMFFYAMDTSGLPLVPMYLVFLFVCSAWGALGGLAVAALIHVKRVGLAVGATLSAVVGFGLFLFITLDQYMHVGTTRQYLAGTAGKMTDDAAFVTATNISPIIFGLAAVGIIALQVRRARAS